MHISYLGDTSINDAVVWKAGRCMWFHLDSLLGGNCVGSFVDEVCSMQAHDVDSQDLSCVLAIDHLGHALTLLLCQGLHSYISPSCQNVFSGQSAGEFVEKNQHSIYCRRLALEKKCPWIPRPSLLHASVTCVKLTSNTAAEARPPRILPGEQNTVLSPSLCITPRKQVQSVG